MSKFSYFLNLKSIPCPLNLVKCKLALEKLRLNHILTIELDKGEPELMVKKFLMEKGYKFQILKEENDWIRLEITNER